MNRTLTLIPIIGIFTTSLLVSIPRSVSAYYVHNKATYAVNGIDTSKGNSGFLTKHWQKSSLTPGSKDYYPSNNNECQCATIKVTGKLNSSCQAGADAKGKSVIYSTSTSNGVKLDCNINEPV
jgi:hypothetical protein